MSLRGLRDDGLTNAEPTGLSDLLKLGIRWPPPALAVDKGGGSTPLDHGVFRMMLSPQRWRLKTLRVSMVLPLSFLFFLCVGPVFSWPLVLNDQGSKVTLSKPDYTTWDFLQTGMRIPVRIEPSGEAPILCTLTAQASTYADRVAKNVLLKNIQVQAVDVNQETQRSAVGKAAPEALRASLAKLLASQHWTIEMAEIVDAFADKKNLPSVEISSETPRIFSSTKPAILVQFDGPPMWLPVAGTKLSHGVNTNWDMFYDNKNTFYYLLAGDLWLATHDLYSGEWVLPKTLPKELRSLPNTSEYASARATLPYTADPNRTLPEVFYSEKAAELVIVNGTPQLREIPGTDLSWVENTEADLFFHAGERRYFTVITGRWFSAERIDGYWRDVTNLPVGFSQIPGDHPKARIKIHVAGTAEARREALWSLVPQLAQIRRTEATIQVDFAGKPNYVPIDGTSLLHVPNATVPVVSHAGKLYACYHAVWFQADDPKGPWTVATSLPSDIYRIPSRSPVYHLSFVRLVDSDKDTVTFGYTGGYENTLVYQGAVVYGPGFDNPPALQYGAYTYPVYFAQPSTYGAGAWYDAERHVFLRGRPGYGPFGGFGATSRYNSVTSHYFRPIALFGADHSADQELAFQPYTGAYGKLSADYSPYALWTAAMVPWSDRGSSKRPGMTIQVGKPVLSSPDGAPLPSEVQSFRNGKP